MSLCIPFGILWNPFVTGSSACWQGTLGEVDTLQTIQLIAAKEKRTPEEIADSILINALLNHQAQEENYIRWQSLTRREKEVAALVCLHYNTQEIVTNLHIATNCKDPCRTYFSEVQRAGPEYFENKFKWMGF